MTGIRYDDAFDVNCHQTSLLNQEFAEARGTPVLSCSSNCHKFLLGVFIDYSTSILFSQSGSSRTNQQVAELDHSDNGKSDENCQNSELREPKWRLGLRRSYC